MAANRTRGVAAHWERLPWSVLGAPWYYRRVAVIASGRRAGLVRSARRQAATLAVAPEPAARRLAHVLDVVRRDRVDPQTGAALRQIERARRRLLRSAATVAWSAGRDAPVAWVCALASQPAVGARVLFHCVSTWRPTTALELGTCVGVSAAYQSCGQRGVPGARLITVEGYAGLSAQAQTLFADAGVAGVERVVGLFDDVLPGILQVNSIDYAYVDGHHDGDATMRYFASIQGHCRAGALLVFDDIDYSAGMASAWAAIRHSEHVAATATLGKLGLAVVR